MRIPRSRGAVSGVLLIALGAWAALAPLIGPSFDFTTDSSGAWSLTADTFWLSVLPGAAALIGGIVLLVSANRATAMLGTWLAIAAGAWLVAGDQITGLSVSEAGEFEHLLAFEGLGAAIAAIAAFALGRLAVRSVRDEQLAREAQLAAADADGPADRPRPTRESGRFDRAEEMPTTAATATHATESRTDTLTAADRVRQVAGERDGRRGLFRRRS